MNTLRPLVHSWGGGESSTLKPKADRGQRERGVISDTDTRHWTLDGATARETRRASSSDYKIVATLEGSGRSKVAATSRAAFSTWQSKHSEATGKDPSTRGGPRPRTRGIYGCDQTSR